MFVKHVDFAYWAIGHCLGLEKLDVMGLAISDIGLKEFGPLSKLIELNLSGNPVCKEVRVCAQMPRLAHLRLLHTTVDDEGLLALRGHPELRELYPGNSTITDKSGVVLATIPHLTELDLSNTAITDSTGVTLAKAPDLDFLSLSGTGISVETIRALKQATKLECLFLEKIVVDAEMLRALNELPSLEKLSIGGKNYMRIPQQARKALHYKLKRGITFSNRN